MFVLTLGILAVMVLLVMVAARGKGSGYTYNPPPERPAQPPGPPLGRSRRKV